MCGHHDTVFDTPGGNDNASGAIGVIETAKTINNFFITRVRITLSNSTFRNCCLL
jgi:Zn-dependent M28 family amino/carboxypeptidase